MNEPTKVKPDPEEQRGLVCPKCGCGQFFVVYTRPARDSKIVRSRECRHCGRRMITYERVAF